MTLREIDVLVAEKFFRITTILESPAYRDPECGQWQIWYPAWDVMENSAMDKRFYTERILTYCPDPSSIWREELPHYTTDPVAAKRIRASLINKFAALQIEWTAGLVYCGTWNYFDGGDALRNMFEADASTEELAVALCALRTVGIKIDPADVVPVSATEEK